MPSVYIEDIFRPRDKELDLQGLAVEELQREVVQIQLEIKIVKRRLFWYKIAFIASLIGQTIFELK